MPAKNLVKKVIEFLEQNHYKYLYHVHKGHFGNVIAVLDPDGRKLAVKIVKKENISPIEDKYWKILHYPNLLQLQQSFTVEDLLVKIYLMPLLTTSLEDVYHSESFRNDQESFKRMRKWMLQILCGIDYLHSRGLCYLNVGIESICIDEKDNTILTDFSNLNYTTSAVNR